MTDRAFSEVCASCGSISPKMDSMEALIYGFGWWPSFRWESPEIMIVQWRCFACRTKNDFSGASGRSQGDS